MRTKSRACKKRDVQDVSRTMSVANEGSDTVHEVGTSVGLGHGTVTTFDDAERILNTSISVSTTHTYEGFVDTSVGVHGFNDNLCVSQVTDCRLGLLKRQFVPVDDHSLHTTTHKRCRLSGTDTSSAQPPFQPGSSSTRVLKRKGVVVENRLGCNDSVSDRSSVDCCLIDDSLPPCKKKSVSMEETLLCGSQRPTSPTPEFVHASSSGAYCRSDETPRCEPVVGCVSATVCAEGCCLLYYLFFTFVHQYSRLIYGNIFLLSCRNFACKCGSGFPVRNCKAGSIVYSSV